MDTIDWLVFDEAARNEITNDFVYHVKTAQAEYSGMYPNGEGFHCQNPGEGRRVPMSNVTHYAVHMTFDDHADQYVFKRE